MGGLGHDCITLWFLITPETRVQSSLSYLAAEKIFITPSEYTRSVVAFSTTAAAFDKWSKHSCVKVTSR